MKRSALLFVVALACMRPSGAAAAATPAPAASPSPSPSKIVGPFRMTAGRVNFYYNRFVVTGTGDVHLQMGDGTRLTGDAFWMDLRLNRFVIAGNVRLITAQGEQDGAAFSEYFDFDRAYFIPLTTEPDRWTYAQGDYAHPLRGRLMPGDTFFLPDLSGERVFLYAKSAAIAPRASVRFTPASINLGPTYLPFVSYFLTFSQNPNFGQNSLPNATIDVPLYFAGGSNSLSTLHLRYDPLNKIYPSIEQHQVSANHYIVGSIGPLTRPLKIYNLLALDHVFPKTQVTLFAQETAFQHDFSTPLSATAFVNTQITQALHGSYLLLSGDQYYQSLLARPAPGIGGQLYYGDPSHPWVPDHPNDLSLTWNGFQHRINKTPFYFTLRSGVEVAANDISPLATLGGVNYHTIWTHFIGANVTLPSLVLLRDKYRHNVLLNVSVDKQRQWSSLPHYIDTTVTTFSISKAINDRVTVFGGYTIDNTGDFYGPQQSLAYPVPAVPISPLTNLAYPGYTAFRGFSTTRSLVEQLVWAPSTAFSLSGSMRENDDFPAPIPYPAGYGQNTISPGEFGTGAGSAISVGNPPYQATLDVHFRVNSVLSIDIQRSYLFNFGGYYRWPPAVIQASR